MPLGEVPRLGRLLTLFEGRHHPPDMPFPAFTFTARGSWRSADSPIGAELPDQTAETRLGYPWPPWIGLWAPQGHAALRFDWRGLAVAVATGPSTLPRHTRWSWADSRSIWGATTRTGPWRPWPALTGLT